MTGKSPRTRFALYVESMGGSYSLDKREELAFQEKLVPGNLQELEDKDIDPVYVAVQANLLNHVKFWHKIGMPLDKTYPGGITLQSLATRYGFTAIAKYLADSLKNTPPKPKAPGSRSTL